VSDNSVYLQLAVSNVGLQVGSTSLELHDAILQVNGLGRSLTPTLFLYLAMNASFGAAPL